MPSFVVKQPDGRLAIFSTVTDSFTCVNATEEELFEELCENMGRKDARTKILRGVNDEPLQGGLHIEFQSKTFKRWHYALSCLNPDAKKEIRSLVPDCFK